jgi:hypothetical protein
MSWAAAVVLSAVTVFSAVRAIEPLGSHMTPPTQPPLGVIAGRDLTPVQAIFNRDAGHPRIFVLLSPT